MSLDLEITLPSRIGLIAGGTKYPILIAKEAQERKKRIYAVALKGETEEEIEKFVVKVKWIEPGELATLFDFLKEHAISHVIMAGKVSKRLLFQSSVKLDQLAESFFSRLQDRRDLALLKAFSQELERRGFTLIDSRTFVEQYVPARGFLNNVSLSEKEWDDVRFGWAVAKKLSSLDIGLTVVVKQHMIVAVEAMEGTDETIRRAGRLAQAGIIVIKVARPQQDLRFDLPVVGKDTILTLIEVKGRALAIEAEKTLFFDKEEALLLAEKNNISVISL